MNRDLRKSIQEYDERFGNARDGAFYISDIDQLVVISGFDRHFDIIKLISTALKAGFMVGYRRAKREKHNI